MLTRPDYMTARQVLLEHCAPVGTESVSLFRCTGRLLAQDVIAAENVPSFERSPYDGYALRSADVVSASKDAPVTLKILEEIAAGSVPTCGVTEGTASKILTGAPIPEGADCVINFEVTEFTAETVTLFAPLKKGKNIVRVGEDVMKGTVLASAGHVIDAGTCGTIAAQGILSPLVYKVPRVAVLSTGSELVEPDAEVLPGKIRNSNAYTICAALSEAGIEPVYLGIAGDDVDQIRELYQLGFETCDAVISTGGVSVGDYDLTPDALEQLGAEILIQGVDLKPGMACAYAVRDGKLAFALSGNPASCMINYYTVALPALKKLCGSAEPLPEEFDIRLLGGFGKKSGSTRILRGTLCHEDGMACMKLPASQGNVVLSTTIGCDTMAIIPSKSDPVPYGTILKGFLIK